jgi:hypothetical protein
VLKGSARVEAGWGVTLASPNISWSLSVYYFSVNSSQSSATLLSLKVRREKHLNRKWVLHETWFYGLAMWLKWESACLASMRP